MNKLARAIVVAGIGLSAGGVARAQHAGLAADTDVDEFVSPKYLTLQQQQPPETIYAPPEAMAEETQVNAGGVNFKLNATYFTDYIFRGIDRSETSGTEDSGNVQIDGNMRFELERFPDLFMGVFTNINDADPISRFQEIRPYYGLELSARPIIFSIANVFYIFPDRDQVNTAEIVGRLMLDDSYFFRTDDPVFSPYVLAAWDYDKHDGFYIEAGVRHDFQLEDLPLTISPIARAAYVLNHKAFRTIGLPGLDPSFEAGTTGEDTGLQHYEIGLEISYRLNELLNIPPRYGQLDFKGYLFYTDGLQNDLRADTELYGGVGVGFRY